MSDSLREKIIEAIKTPAPQMEILKWRGDECYEYIADRILAIIKPRFEKIKGFAECILVASKRGRYDFDFADEIYKLCTLDEPEPTAKAAEDEKGLYYEIGQLLLNRGVSFVDSLDLCCKIADLIKESK